MRLSLHRSSQLRQKQGGVSVRQRRGLRDGNPLGFGDRAAHPQELIRGGHRDLSVRLDENPTVWNDAQNICVFRGASFRFMKTAAVNVRGGDCCAHQRRREIDTHMYSRRRTRKQREEGWSAPTALSILLYTFGVILLPTSSLPLVIRLHGEVPLPRSSCSHATAIRTQQNLVFELALTDQAFRLAVSPHIYSRREAEVHLDTALSPPVNPACTSQTHEQQQQPKKNAGHG